MDAAGRQIPGVWVYETYTGWYRVTGDKGDDPYWGPGEAEFNSLDGGRMCIASSDGGVCESELTRDLPCHDPPPFEDLWAAGYCECLEGGITRELPGALRFGPVAAHFSLCLACRVQALLVAVEYEEDDMPVTQTKGQVEAQIAAMVTAFERDQMGRGPREVRVWILEDMILVRLKGVLTPAEERLSSDPNGRHLLKQVRTRLIENSRAVLEESIENLTGVAMISLHSDLSIRAGERIIVLTLAENLEARFRQ